jgi:hypothetical protein
VILARHAETNDMPALANQAYEYSRTAFRQAFHEKQAFEIGEKIKDLEG